MTQNQIAYKNAKEVERHNLATEAETQRHQMVQEALNRWQNALTNWQIAVNNAHYVRMDSETERANRAREQQNMLGLAETQRANIANENIKRASNAIQSATQQETSRHNAQLETIQRSLNDSVIALNEKEGYYTEAKTRTESYRPGEIINQIDLTNSQANLNREKLNTEKIGQLSTTVNTAVNALNAGTNILKVIVPTMNSGHGSNLVELVNSLK